MRTRLRKLISDADINLSMRQYYKKYYCPRAPARILTPLAESIIIFAIAQTHPYSVLRVHWGPRGLFISPRLPTYDDCENLAKNTARRMGAA